MKVILGIDPGSQFAGFGIVELREGSQLLHLDHGVIEISKKLSFPEKLDFLALKIDSVIRKYKPTDTVVENIFLGKNAQSAFKLGHVRGVCLQLASRSGSQVHEYAARTVKKVVTGQGGATKEHVALIAQNLLGIETTTKLDATDALALCICHGRKWESEELVGRQLN